MATSRRRRIGHRRRVEDEEDDEAGREAIDIDEDSMSEGSIGTDDHDAADDSDTSNIDETSPTSAPVVTVANGTTKNGRHSAGRKDASSKKATDTELMLHGLTINDEQNPAQEMNFDDVESPSKSLSEPVVASSASAARQEPDSAGDRRRQEHEDYKKRRDADPAFVPNRGSFFMHDHRHAGPAANGFRPFGRGRGRGGRGAIGGPYAPMNQMHHPGDPTTNSPWTHDMHETVAEPIPRRPRNMREQHGPPHGNSFIPTCESNSEPINRTLSTEKALGKAQVRVFLPHMKAPALFSGMPVKQYTKLPDHRPPLRRDKPVRISLPQYPPRFIYPAADRSFIFIPRAMRPNQQRVRGKPRSGFGSVGGFSRRTSIYGGGGSYYGSMYSPSIALSRRSSIVQDRDYMFSPAASVVSRPPVPLVDNVRPVVRLPPAPQSDLAMAQAQAQAGSQFAPFDSASEHVGMQQLSAHQSPQPQQPVMQENRPASIPMHQPRPQKNISVAHIESPTLVQGPPQAFQQAFHQQVPVGMTNGRPSDAHVRQPSYQSTGTPLSQIPERAIHAAPFQPHAYAGPPYYSQPGSFPPQPQQPQQTQQQQPFYYPPSNSGPPMAQPVAPPPFNQGTQGPSQGFGPQSQAAQGGLPPSQSGSNLVAQEVNGMVYYYDASQLPPVNTYQQYPTHQGYQSNMMGMGGLVTPSPDGFYYQQGQPGMMYYSQ